MWLSIPYAVLFVATFLSPNLSDQGKVIYAFTTYALLMLVYTGINIPYSALGGVMTKNITERASLQSYRMALAMAGGAVVVYTVPILVEYFGAGDDAAGYPLAIFVMALVAIACFFFCFISSEERVTHELDQGAGVNIAFVFKDFASLRHNSQLVLISFFTFLILVAVVMRGTVTAYYIKYFFGREDLINEFITWGMLAGIAGALTTSWLTKRYCKVLLLRLGMVSMIALHLPFLLLTGEDISYAFCLSIAANFPHMMVMALLFAMVPDTVEYGAQIATEKVNKMALAFSGHLLALKFGIAAGGSLALGCLAYFGYVANAEQSERALNGIMLTYVAGPVVCGFIVLMLLPKYVLSNEKMREIGGVVKSAN
ncbi:MAG: MFS transporter [Porticoccaceae bacterium]|nr:MFS transporter [Porticoccaceae bacterium]